MFFYRAYVFVTLFQVFSLHLSFAKEPMCSKFPYDEQLLEKMIRTEIKVEMMQSDIKETQTDILNTLNDAKRNVADIMDSFTKLKNNFTDEILTRVKNIEKNLGTYETPAIAFYVHYITDRLLDVTDAVVKFDKAITNEGGGYDTSTGVFTAPVDGLYQFTVHICAARGFYSFIGLVVGEEVIAKNSNFEANYETCSSMGAVVRVKSGDKIWVKCTSGSTNRKLMENSVNTNTFSGILINN